MRKVQYSHNHDHTAGCQSCIGILKMNKNVLSVVPLYLDYTDPTNQPPSTAATWYCIVIFRMHLLSTYHMSGPLPATRNSEMTKQSFLSSWCSLPKAITTQGGKCCNQSTERVPTANVVERGCSGSFHREVMLVDSSRIGGRELAKEVQRKKEDSGTRSLPLVTRGNEFMELWKKKNLARGEGGHKGSGEKEWQERKTNGSKSRMVKGFSQEVTTTDTSFRKRTLVEKEAG